MSDFPFANEDLLSDWLVAGRLEEARRGGDRQARATLLSLTELAEAIDRFCGESERGDLPPDWRADLLLLQAKAQQCLADHGVSPITAVGQKLDPRLHLVVEVRAGPGEPETIVRQVRPGYLWKGQVLRPVEVVTIDSPPAAQTREAN